jgi:hypothetical protein
MHLPDEQPSDVMQAAATAPQDLTETRSHRSMARCGLSISIEHVDVDTNSVQDDIFETGTEGETGAATIVQGTNPSLTVKLKLSLPKASKFRRDRKRLPLALINGLSTDTRSDTPLVETLALMKSLRRADKMRLREALGDASELKSLPAHRKPNYFLHYNKPNNS